MKTKISIVFHTKVRKIYFCKCTHLLFFFILLRSYNSPIPLLHKDSHSDSLHSHPHSMCSQSNFPHSHPGSLHFLLIPCIPPPILHIPTLIPCISIIPTLIPHITIILIIPFPDFPFRLLQIANNKPYMST